MPRLGVYLQEHAPGVHIHAAPYSVLNLVQHLEREGADMALGTNLDDTRQAKELRTHALWPIQSSCFMRRGHPLARGKLTLPRFLEARHVDVLLPGMTSALYDTLLSEHGHTRNLVLSVNHYNHVLSLIAGSDYIGVLPTTLVDLSPERSQLYWCDPPIPVTVRSLVMTWHQRHDTRPAHTWLRRVIAQLFTSTESTFAMRPEGAGPGRQTPTQDA
jgi:DNA-binding transcriptional LysR family regulator